MAHDQRDITLKPSTNSIEPTRTGPRTEKLRREQEEEAKEDTENGAQVGYGNSRTADGESEKDAADDT